MLYLTEAIRNHLNELISEKQDLLDPEIIVASKMLDSVLNEYYQILIKSKMDK